MIVHVTRIAGPVQTNAEYTVRTHKEWTDLFYSLKPHPHCTGISHDAYDTICSYTWNKTYLIATLHKETTPC